jgi:hypothetical protein
MPGQVTVKPVQPPPRDVHVIRRFCGIQGQQLPGETDSVIGPNPSCRPGLKEALDAFVAEALDHA